MDDTDRGITSDRLAQLLTGHRANDVYVEITDEDTGVLNWVQAYGVRYDPTTDSVVILARRHY